MMKLEKKEFYEIGIDVVQDLMEEHLGVTRDDFEIIAEEEMHNGATVWHGIGENRGLDHYNQLIKDFEGFKAGEKYHMMYGAAFMELLSLKGHIPAGNYILDHSW